MKKLFYFILLMCILGGAPSRTNTYTAGEVIDPDEVMTDQNNIYTYLQQGVDTYAAGSIENEDVSASAAIAASKIDLSGIAQSLIFTDGYKIDMDAINTSSTSEGLFLPQAASCASGTAEGQMCWDTDNDLLYVGDGTAANSVVEYSVKATDATARTMSAASGDVSYTGIGFGPNACIFMGAIDGDEETATWGFASGAGKEGALYYDDALADLHFVSDRTMDIYTGTTDYQKAVFKTMDSDGFTLTWAKGGSPSGTFDFNYLCFK